MGNKPFLKICGITRTEDLQEVINSGADAIGFIAFPKSPRYISPAKLKELLGSCNTKGVLKVGVFVNTTLDEINAYIESGIDVIQLHGDETAEFASKLDSPVWRALRLKGAAQINEYKDFPCDKFLIDSFVKGSEIPGGTGHVANWELAREFIKATDSNVLLAGGLKSSNLQEAYAEVKPFGFDLSSGVETSPGIKSAEKIADLIKALNSLT